MKIDVTIGLENVARYNKIFRETGDATYRDKAKKLLSIIEMLAPKPRKKK